MHIQFDSLYLKRFRSFLEETILHFNSAGIGLYFLKGKNNVQAALGSNGSGKSSLLDALMWCLYGKTVQGLKNPDITPWSGKGQTIVEVRFTIDDQKHAVRRTVNPNLIQIDGKEASQEYIDRLIPIPSDVIPYTIIMGQRQPLFFDLTASEKLKIFSEPLNLERWEARSDHAAELTRKLEVEVATKENECELLTKQAKQLTGDIANIKARRDQWENDRNHALEGKDKEKKELQAKINAVMKECDTADLQLDRAETEIRALNIRTFQLEENNAARKVLLVETDLKAACNKERQLRDMVASIKDETCPTCEQPIKSAKMREQLAKNIEGQIAGLKIKELISDRDNAIKAHAEAKLRLQTQEVAEKQFIKASNEARDVLDHLLPKITTWEAAIKAIDKLKEEYENQDNPYKEQFTNLRKRKSFVEQQIEDATKLVASKREHCERVRFWIKGFKEIKLYTLTEILQELQLTTNGLLEEFGLVNWKITYDVERETKSKTIARGLNIVVLSPNNTKAVKWESWSGGEAQRLRLLGSIALGSVLLNHLGVSTNLCVFDEPTESLSKEGVADLVELLATYAKDSSKSVIMIDHHLIESSSFVDVITVQKDKQGSHIIGS